MTSRDSRTRWCHLSTLPGTILHCLVNTEGSANFLGTRSLVYSKQRCTYPRLCTSLALRDSSRNTEDILGTACMDWLLGEYMERFTHMSLVRDKFLASHMDKHTMVKSIRI